MTLPTAVTTNQELDMGALKYHVKVPQLAKAMGLGAMDLVRMCDVAVNTAYKVLDSQRADEVSLDTCWKIFKGLRDNDLKLKNGQAEREITFVGDIVVFVE